MSKLANNVGGSQEKQLTEKINNNTQTQKERKAVAYGKKKNILFK